MSGKSLYQKCSGKRSAWESASELEYKDAVIWVEFIFSKSVKYKSAKTMPLQKVSEYVLVHKTSAKYNKIMQHSKYHPLLRKQKPHVLCTPDKEDVLKQEKLLRLGKHQAWLWQGQWVTCDQHFERSGPAKPRLTRLGSHSWSRQRRKKATDESIVQQNARQR